MYRGRSKVIHQHKLKTLLGSLTVFWLLLGTLKTLTVEDLSINRLQLHKSKLQDVHSHNLSL